MLKGGVIMDVTNAEEARIAEEAGAVAVMALERVPADIRKDGGVARMSDPEMIRQIKKAVTIPVMAKARIGHFVEAQILEALGVDYVDESEVRPRSLVTPVPALAATQCCAHSAHTCTASCLALRKGGGRSFCCRRPPRHAWIRRNRAHAGAHAGGRGAPHQQAQLQGALCVRLPRPGRGAAPHCRGRRHDPHQGARPPALGACCAVCIGQDTSSAL